MTLLSNLRIPRSAKPRTKRSALSVMKRPPMPVLLEYQDESAHRVCVAGSFNDWDASGMEMTPMGSGRWVKELLLSPGSYEYRFVVDGHWISDPAQTRTAPNPFGELNSLLIVEPGRPGRLGF